MADRFRVDRCPTYLELVAAYDNEVSPDEWAILSAHVGQCVGCRDRWATIEGVSTRVAQALYEDDLIGWEDNVPSDTHDAKDTDTKETSTTEMNTTTTNGVPYNRGERMFKDFQRRLHAKKQADIVRGQPHVWRHGLVAAAVIGLLVAGIAVSYFQTVPVQAEELLERAAAFQQRLPPELVQRIQSDLSPGVDRAARQAAAVRIKAFSNIREIARGDGSRATLVSVTGNADQEALARLLASHGFSWDDPLNVTRFRTWRDSIADKQERVLRTREGTLALYTTTSSGVLREAHIEIRPETFHTVRLTLVFEGVGTAVFAEIGQRTRALPDERQSHYARTPARPRPATPETSAHERSTRTIAPAPGTQIANVLVDRFHSDKERSDAFVTDVVRTAASVRRSMTTLSELAKAHPEGQVRQLSPAAHAELQRQLVQHHLALRRNLQTLDTRLNTLFAVSRPEVFVTPPQMPSDWQRRSVAGLRLAERLEKLVHRLLTKEHVDVNTQGQVINADRHPARVTLDALRNEVFAAQP